MAKMVKLNDEVYEFLRKEQAKLSKQKLRHVSFSEVIAHLARRDVEKIALYEEKLKEELEKRISAFVTQRGKLEKELEEIEKELERARERKAQLKAGRTCKHGFDAKVCLACRWEDLVAKRKIER